jgi:hypothetical protein
MRTGCGQRAKGVRTNTGKVRRKCEASAKKFRRALCKLLKITLMGEAGNRGVRSKCEEPCFTT